MVENAPGCWNSLSNFTDSCLLDPTKEGFGLRPVISNIQNGVCPLGVYSIFHSCIQKSVFNLHVGALPCYGNFQEFKPCLPGANAHLTNAPMKCYALSYLTFISNESMLFLPETVSKTVMLLVTNLLRAAENRLCLPICPKHDYVFMGPEETEYEISRYVVGGFNKIGLPALSAGLGLISIGPVAGVVMGGMQYLAGNFFNFLAQLTTAFPQQRLRSRDQQQALTKCKEEPWIEIELPNFVNEAIEKTTQVANQNFNAFKTSAHKMALNSLDFTLDQLNQMATEVLDSVTKENLSTAASDVYSGLEIAYTYTAYTLGFLFNQTSHLAPFLLTAKPQNSEELSQETPVSLSPMNASEEFNLERDRVEKLAREKPAHPSTAPTVTEVNMSEPIVESANAFNKSEKKSRAVDIANNALNQLGFDASFLRSNDLDEVFQLIVR